MITHFLRLATIGLATLALAPAAQADTITVGTLVLHRCKAGYDGYCGSIQRRWIRLATHRARSPSASNGSPAPTDPARPRHHRCAGRRPRLLDDRLVLRLRARCSAPCAITRDILLMDQRGTGLLQPPAVPVATDLQQPDARPTIQNAALASARMPIITPAGSRPTIWPTCWASYRCRANRLLRRFVWHLPRPAICPPVPEADPYLDAGQRLSRWRALCHAMVRHRIQHHPARTAHRLRPLPRLCRPVRRPGGPARPSGGRASARADQRQRARRFRHPHAGHRGAKHPVHGDGSGGQFAHRLARSRRRNHGPGSTMRIACLCCAWLRNRSTAMAWAAYGAAEFSGGLATSVICSDYPQLFDMRDTVAHPPEGPVHRRPGKRAPGEAFSVLPLHH